MSTLLAVSGAVALVLVVWMASRNSRARHSGDGGSSSSDGGSASSDCPDYGGANGFDSGGCDGGGDGGGGD